MTKNFTEFSDSLREKAVNFRRDQQERLEQELADIKLLLSRGSIALDDVVDQADAILSRAKTGEDT